ncbi:MAG TPA: hypothetical protein VEH31_16000, partial [Streptosporangiaceae bacterium]|nr:hypothetical protein [Streptosporangiaceae bacterium]
AEVAFTSIYTCTDGVVVWQTCLVPFADNIEVPGSHCGLAFNRHAYRHIADALAAEEPPRRAGRVSPGVGTPADGRLRWDVPQAAGTRPAARRRSVRRLAPVPRVRS